MFGHYQLSGSEQALSLSGIEAIGLNLLTNNFDYSFLEHIHKKQILKETPSIEYSGAPMPFRFGENNNKKLVSYKFYQDDITKDYLTIPSFRKLVCLECGLENFKEKIQDLMGQTNSEFLNAFLEIIVIIDKPVSGIADQARIILNESKIDLLSFQYRLQKKVPR